MISKVNTAIDELELEGVNVTTHSDPADFMKVIGLFAPIIIGMIEAWKLVPGVRMKRRNAKLDILITALKAASIFYNIK